MIDSRLIAVIAPCVSIVVITYNRLQLLKETLATVLSQTYTDFELIIVDNMSTDGTEQFVSTISDARVRYFRNPNNGVIAVNRNYGVKQAVGKYIAFCDDDDLWLPEKLELQVTLLEQNVDMALCYTNAESFSNNQIIANRMVRRVVHKNHFMHLLQGNFIPNSSVLIRRDALLNIGLLTENPVLREDYEMCLRIAKLYSIVGIDSSLIRYRMHTGNVAGNRASETLRAIRTLKSVIKLLGVPRYLAYPNIVFQYLKYIYYRISSRKFV